MIKYLEIAKGEYIRVWAADIQKIEKKDYPNAHKDHRYQISISYRDRHGVYSYATREERDEKLDKLLSMLYVEKENTHE